MILMDPDNTNGKPIKAGLPTSSAASEGDTDAPTERATPVTPDAETAGEPVGGGAWKGGAAAERLQGEKGRQPQDGSLGTIAPQPRPRQFRVLLRRRDLRGRRQKREHQDEQSTDAAVRDEEWM